MKYIREIILIVLLVLIVLLWHPFGMMPMSPTGEMITLGIFLAVFAAGIFFLFRERPRDEREAVERNAISRVAYLAAAIVLVLGITVRELNHMTPDPWLIGALVVMILAKIFGSAYFKAKE